MKNPVTRLVVAGLAGLSLSACVGQPVIPGGMLYPSGYGSPLYAVPGGTFAPYPNLQTPLRYRRWRRPVQEPRRFRPVRPLLRRPLILGQLR